MTALIPRLEALTGPSREMDAEIFCQRPLADYEYGRKLSKVRGRVVVQYENSHGTQTAPTYTSSLDAARTLLEKLPMQQFQVGWQYMGMGDWMGWAKVDGFNGRGTAEASLCDNPAIALCIAALKAMEAG